MGFGTFGKLSVYRLRILPLNIVRISANPDDDNLSKKNKKKTALWLLWIKDLTFYMLFSILGALGQGLDAEATGHELLWTPGGGEY